MGSCFRLALVAIVAVLTVFYVISFELYVVGNTEKVPTAIREGEW